MTIGKIKDLYSQLDKKQQFIDGLAGDIGRSPNYLRNYWFTLWNIPRDKQDRTLELLQQVIDLQRQFNDDYVNIFKS